MSENGKIVYYSHEGQSTFYKALDDQRPQSNTSADAIRCLEELDTTKIKKTIEDLKKSQKEGIKHDSEKPRLDLLSSRWLIGTGSVLGFGAKKYADNNWRSGIKYSRLIAALMRHVVAYNGGEDNDPESGLSHLYHASCCLMFLSEFSETRPDLDDRYKEIK